MNQAEVEHILAEDDEESRWDAQVAAQTEDLPEREE